MLTSDLLRIKKERGVLVPRYLKRADQNRLLPVAETMVGVVEDSLGRRREELEDELDAVGTGARDRLVAQGLRKLLLDRCEFATSEGIDPVDARQATFRLAAERRRELGPKDAFDRVGVITDAAASLETTTEALEERLFADLKGREELITFKKVSGTELLQRYDVALAQGVLLRATSVQIALDGEAPGRVRQLFREARFRGLLHRVRTLDEGQYLIELDGPFSLFSSVQKYGLELALFLPAVLRCKRWRLRAEILWGKGKQRFRFELGPEQGLVPHQKRIKGVAPGLAKFVDRFRKQDCAWDVRENDTILALPGEQACVPDLVFENRETGEEVFFEAFGFWSRKAVWDRIETIQRGFPSRIILAISKNLRVSEELLDPDEVPGELYVYKQALRPKAVLERLEARG